MRSALVETCTRGRRANELKSVVFDFQCGRHILYEHAVGQLTAEPAAVPQEMTKSVALRPWSAEHPRYTGDAQRASANSRSGSRRYLVRTILLSICCTVLVSAL